MGLAEENTGTPEAQAASWEWGKAVEDSKLELAWEFAGVLVGVSGLLALHGLLMFSNAVLFAVALRLFSVLWLLSHCF